MTGKLLAGIDQKKLEATKARSAKTNMLGVSFFVLLVINVVLVVYNRMQQNIPDTTPEFKKFQLTYLVVYLLMTAADWMQGPYVYALYEFYGFSISQIGALFITGFGSSMIFGTFIGSLSDKFGRKMMCILYAILYGLSCATKHSSQFEVLLLGRLLGGVATSILFSSFEAWMVSEHFKRGYSEDWLGYTFYLQVFGNSVVAIVSGLVAGFVKETFQTMTAPFDTAILLLAAGGIIVFFTWTENYGNSSVDLKESFIAGFNTLRKDMKVAALGVGQGMFESAMYIFVFMWTPTLDKTIPNLNHGLVFANYMVAVMIGSSLFSLIGGKYLKREVLLLYVFLAASLAFIVPILFPNSGMLVFISFLVFEACVGLFWPSIGTLKGTYIPENVRSTVMNYFRVPTNLFVVLALNKVSEMRREVVFGICVIMLLVSAVSQIVFINLITNESKKTAEYEPVRTTIDAEE